MKIKIQARLVSYLIIAGVFVSLGACMHTHDHTHDDGHAHATGEDTMDHSLVILSEAQVKAIGLETGTFQQVKLSDYINANGTLDLPPDEFASVTAPARGFVRSIRGEVLVGSYVKQGTLLATLEHPDFIEVQQNYLEVLARHEYQEAEVARQQVLNDANAGALKQLQQATSELKVLGARLQGLQRQLQYLGIEPASVENGEITPTISLIAPISGFVAAVNIHRGQFIEPEAELYEIVSNDHIHLELDVFENDVPAVHEGQRISFTVPSLGGQTYEGEVELVSKSFDRENKTVRVHGHIVGVHPRFIRGLYLEAKIWIDDRTTEALPREAIVKNGSYDVIFVKEANAEQGSSVFRMCRVRQLQSDGSFVSISPIDSISPDAEIVTKQAFFLVAEMGKEKLEHTH